MKRLIVIAASFLAGCNPPADDTPGVFESLNVDRVQPAGCVFTALETESPDMALFITRANDPDYMAYVRFKGETLKLVPPTVPDLSGETFDVTYDVLDYPDWSVNVAAVRNADGVYSGTMTMVETGVSTPLTGRCDG